MQERCDEAEQLLKTLVSPQELVEDDQMYMMCTIRTLARVYCMQGRYEKAEDEFKFLIKLAMVAAGTSTDSYVNEVVFDLAQTYRFQSKTEHAETLLSTLLQDTQDQLGLHDDMVADLYLAIAMLWGDSIHYDIAENYLKSEIAHREQHLGPKHRSTFKVLSDLSTLYNRQQRFHKAVEVSLRTKTLPKSMTQIPEEDLDWSGRDVGRRAVKYSRFHLNGFLKIELSF